MYVYVKLLYICQRNRIAFYSVAWELGCHFFFLFFCHFYQSQTACQENGLTFSLLSYQAGTKVGPKSLTKERKKAERYPCMVMQCGLILVKNLNHGFQPFHLFLF